MANYITQADVEAEFGAELVDQWADIDNDEDAGKISARKDSAILIAETEVDALFRSGPYIVPLAPSSAVDGHIKSLIAQKAGLWLESTRGRSDRSPDAGIYRDLEETANIRLAEYAAGSRQSLLAREDGFSANRGMAVIL